MPNLTEKERLIIRWALKTAIVKIGFEIKKFENIGKTAKQDDVVNWMLENTKFTRKQINEILYASISDGRLVQRFLEGDYYLSINHIAGC